MSWGALCVRPWEADERAHAASLGSGACLPARRAAARRHTQGPAGPRPPADMYAKTIVPIGGLYAGTLWLGNAAYVHLSVSFIQMLKVGRRARAGARG